MGVHRRDRRWLITEVHYHKVGHVHVVDTCTNMVDNKVSSMHAGSHYGLLCSRSYVKLSSMLT